jgi:large subunit ribosomal protein L46
MAVRRSLLRCFHHQRDTPVLGQMPIPACDFTARIGYLLTRNQVVKHDPHPLEQEFANALEREQARYSRVDEESASHFFAKQGLSLDAAGRTEPRQIEEEFFVAEEYKEALKATVQRYEVPRRAQAADILNLAELPDDAPPARHTLQRHLNDFLVLIVKDTASGKWTVPSAPRKPKETVRMTLDRSVAEHHGALFSAYAFSNAPQAVLQPEAAPTLAEPLFIFNATYLAGRPSFEKMEPKVADHAWVRRDELDEYDFLHAGMGEVLRDIAVSSVFDGSNAA